jgi:hypothetical protein
MDGVVTVGREFRWEDQRVVEDYLRGLSWGVGDSLVLQVSSLLIYNASEFGA